MTGIIADGKYKIIEVLRADESYEALLCMDVVVNNDYAMNIVNVYKSKPLIREYLPLYYGMSRDTCSDFKRLLTSSGTISAIFDYHEGEELFAFFEKHPLDAYDEKLAYADALLRQALTLDIVDARVAYSALNGNVVVDAKSGRISFNYIVAPGDPPPEGFLGQMLGSMLHAIFPWDRLLPAEIETFADDLQDGKYKSCVEIYAAWRELREPAAKTRKQYETEAIFSFLVRLCKHRAYRKKREKQKSNRKRG